MKKIYRADMHFECKHFPNMTLKVEEVNEIVFENGDCQYAKYASGHNETGMFKVLRDHPEFVEQRKVRLPLDYETIRKKARI